MTLRLSTLDSRLVGAGKGLESLADLSALEALGADAKPDWAASLDGPDLLQVGQPATMGLSGRMAHQVAQERSFSTDLANFGQNEMPPCVVGYQTAGLHASGGGTGPGSRGEMQSDDE